MSKNELLDDFDQKNQKRLTKREIILWWERKRFIYTLILIGFQLFIIILFKGYEFILNQPINVIQQLLYFTFGANLFYSLGWIIEVIGVFLKSDLISDRFRIIRFTIGLIFSIVWTLLSYSFY